MIGNKDERDALKTRLPEYTESVTQGSIGRNMYVCPICHSGDHGRGSDGAFSLYNRGTRYKCHSCGRGGDIFDLIGEIEHIDDYPGQLERAKELFGSSADGTAVAPVSQYTAAADDAVDYTGFFARANRDLGKTTYHRGISLETLNRFNVGFVENWTHPKAPDAPPSPRLIVPTGRSSYLARDTRDPVPEDKKRYAKSKVGSVRIFNAGALRTARSPVFVVEGELDALSIIDVGGEAIALGSTSGVRRLLELVKDEPPAKPLVIALDNDRAGERAREELTAGLTELGIRFYESDPAGEYKDANEALCNDRERLKQAVEAAVSLADGAIRAEKEEYLKTSAAHHMDSFLNGISRSVNTPVISTGFGLLDVELDGGLYEGLYVVGAISSLGKTTIITQMADQIAQCGQDVLIFSLEMAGSELMAKSMSRHTAIQVSLNNGDIRNAKTARGITDGKRYANYSILEKELIRDAAEAYRRYADHIYISEGLGDIGVQQVGDTIKRHVRITGNTPVVVIDYLQILAPYEVRATDKQNMDKAVLELKRISRDFKTPVLCISSLNRANYNTAISMEAFKESGAIEYSSDVLIGLQLQGAGSKDFDATEAKARNPRNIELVILKNRNGRVGGRIEYRYYPQFNYFEEN